MKSLRSHEYFKSSLSLIFNYFSPLSNTGKLLIVNSNLSPVFNLFLEGHKFISNFLSFILAVSAERRRNNNTLYLLQPRRKRAKKYRA